MISQLACKCLVTHCQFLKGKAVLHISGVLLELSHLIIL